jgi:hypothetical protein
VHRSAALSARIIYSPFIHSRLIPAAATQSRVVNFLSPFKNGDGGWRSEIRAAQSLVKSQNLWIVERMASLQIGFYSHTYRLSQCDGIIGNPASGPIHAKVGCLAMAAVGWDFLTFERTFSNVKLQTADHK